MTLKLNNLSKSYKDVAALKSLSFELEPGKALALLGPNGAGKTTAIKILATLVTPDSGELTHEGVDLFAQPARQRDLIGYVSQEMAMDKVLTGVEMMRFSAGLYHLDWRNHSERALALLKKLGLEDAQHRQTGTYSGGMKRRLDLATALLNSPKVLILDEPTTGLDIEAREQIWGMIGEFTKGGGSLILASHDFREVQELADELLILHGGEVARKGTGQKLKAELGSFVVVLRTREFMDAADFKKVRGIFASWSEPLSWYEDEDSIAMAITTSDDMTSLQARIYEAMKPVGLAGLDIREPGLEDVYRFAVGGAA